MRIVATRDDESAMKSIAARLAMGMRGICHRGKSSVSQPIRVFVSLCDHLRRKFILIESKSEGAGARNVFPGSTSLIILAEIYYGPTKKPTGTASARARELNSAPA